MENITSSINSIVESLSYIIGGIWIYLRFIRRQERYPNIEFLADIELIGEKDGYWIAELIATIDNKGTAKHKMTDFGFDLKGLYPEDNIELNSKWGGQVDFPHEIHKGSFLPEQYTYFFLDPGTKAKYSFITRIPKNTCFVILHCGFNYMDSRNYRHTAEKTVRIPVE